MSDTTPLFGPRVFEAKSKDGQDLYGYDLSFTAAHLDLMREMIDTVKGYGKLRMRKSKTKGTWYTTVVDGRSPSAEVKVRPQTTGDIPNSPPLKDEGEDLLPF